MANNLLTVSNTKTMKGEARGYLTAILHLAPGDIATGKNVCPFMTIGCGDGCLYTAGRGVFKGVQAARIAKTKRFFADRPAFLRDLAQSIAAMQRKAKREGLTLAVRLNGTSDLAWEAFRDATAFGILDAPMLEEGRKVGKNVFEAFPDVQFYDYTKSPARAIAFARGDMPRNYHVTFSRSECNEADARAALARGVNVAVVFADQVPVQHWGHTVVSGDETDLRFLDATGVVIGLTAKGRAKRDSTGFVVR